MSRRTFDLSQQWSQQTAKKLKIPDEDADKSDAYYTSQTFVKNRLKSPTTAKFPHERDITVVPVGDGLTYKIYAFVDSENSYGAMLRTKYYVKMIKDGPDWKLLDIKFGD